MRIAVLADVHGNLAAFEAVLEHAARQKHDAMVILGDVVVGAPDSAACWQLARALSVPIVRGNHDRTLAHFGTAVADPTWSEPRYGPLHWAVAEVSPTERAELAALPNTVRLDDAPELLAVHASLRSDSESVFAYTPPADLPAMFPAPDAALILRGHNHLVSQHWFGATQLITVGSVGMPLDGIPLAQYATLERRRSGWRATHHALPYDLDATLARFDTTGYLERTGPLGRLFRRQIATGANQIAPFFRWYQRWQPAGPIDLETALTRYLAL
jgi:predicted phosphodiesterase